MGYEITFHFHRKDENGKIDFESKESFTKNVGRRNAEVTLEQVAAVILGQFAERTRYISDVEIFEYAKREITFKEVKGGVIIKGKKFNFDQLHGVLKADDEEEIKPTTEQKIEQQVVKPKVVPIPAQNDVPVRFEIYRPNREDFMIHQRQGIKLTMGKKYPLFSERLRMISGPAGPMEVLAYVLNDDNGKKIELSSIYFEPPRIGFENFEDMQPQGNLSYMSSGSPDMPLLRR